MRLDDERVGDKIPLEKTHVVSLLSSKAMTVKILRDRVSER